MLLSFKTKKNGVGSHIVDTVYGEQYLVVRENSNLI